MTTDTTGYTGADGARSWLCVANEVTGATIEASTEDAGFEAEAVRGPQTYSSWSPSALPAWVRAVFVGSSEAQINYFGLYVAEGGGCTFACEYWNGAAWVQIGATMYMGVGESGPLLWIFDNKSASQVRAYISGGSNSVHVATMKAGLATVMPQNLQPGYAPSYLNPDDEFSNVMSHGGQILGSFLQKSEATESLTFNNLTPAWVRSEWQAIRPLFRTEGVFFAWRPESYPDEVFYGMAEGKPTVSYATHIRMVASVTLKGPAP